MESSSIEIVGFVFECFELTNYVNNKNSGTNIKLKSVDIFCLFIVTRDRNLDLISARELHSSAMTIVNARSW